MPPLTLTILASLLQMHGPNSTITSDNKGLDDLLAGVRGELQDHANAGAPPIVEARAGVGGSHTIPSPKPTARIYSKLFKKIYIRTTYVKAIR